MRAAVVLCAAYAGLVAALALALPARLGHMAVEAGATGACLAATVCLLWTGWLARGAERRWRLLVGLTAVIALVAAIVNTRYGIEHDSALPPGFSPVYAVLLVAYLPALAGLFTFPSDPLIGRATAGPRGHRWYLVTAADSILAVGSLTLIFWAALLAQGVTIVRAGTGTALTSLGTAAGSTVLLIAAVLLVTFRRPRSVLVIALLGGGLAALALSSVFYLLTAVMFGARITPAAHLGFVLGWILLLLAPLVPTRPPRPDRAVGPGRRILWIHAALPYASLGVAGTFALGQLVVGEHIDRLELFGLFGLLILIVVRQTMTLGENTHLLSLVEVHRQQLHHQAFHDPLTGLANRALFAERLDRAVARHDRDGLPFAVLFCDLDDFKKINDALGHAAGDELLAVTAARLRAGVRDAGLVARMGGDEFAVVLDHETVATEALARRLAAVVRAPYAISGGRSRTVGASFGLVLNGSADCRSVRPTSADGVLRDADAAMYAAKRQGKDRLVIYRPDLAADDSIVRARCDLAEALRAEPAKGVMSVVYRPVVDLREGQTVVAADATPRWDHPLLGPLDGEPLCRLAAEAGLVRELDAFLLRTVCGDLALSRGWTAGGQREPVAFVPVASGRVVDEELRDELTGLVAAACLHPGALVLLLTDTSGIADLAAVAAVLRRLAGFGVRIALDDVGGDRHTLAAIASLPVQFMRLDRALTEPARAPDRELAVEVRDAVLGAARRRKLAVLADGIADHAAERSLAALGCQLGAGTLYGPPRTLIEVFGHIRDADSAADGARVPAP
jgi:diguanylate cyclase (GGDEF)-like protein